MSVITYIGLGSNLGDSQRLMAEAYQKLALLGQVKASRLYHSPPMGPQDQPHYHNAVVRLEVELSALALLDQLQKIEQEAGRVRLRHWGERTLDLDLLLYGEEQIKNDRLIVPHVGILERDFVILPLLDLDEELKIHGRKIREMDIAQNSQLKVLADSSWINI
jgi:2-amino-4-hydroxy-6-hydroxymethyldihydropteridine diphosphokinase